MTTKFEQLIEYVINDEQAKARELFHDIVVEKSRQIYEEMMQEEEKDLEESEETVEEAKDEDEEDKEKVEENMDEALGGDQTDDLIDDVEAEEQGMAMEADDEDMDMGGDEELEDRVVDLEDKLDELMAEFEALMGDEGSMGSEEEIDMDVDMGGEGDMDVDMDSEEVVDDELETEGMMEAVSLKAVPAPKHGDDGANSKSPVAANSGARGAMAKPVKMTGDTAQGRPAPTAKDAIGKVGNTPAQSTQEPKPATKPTLSQASGVNTKSVIK
jgi:hypothetical protein